MGIFHSIGMFYQIGINSASADKVDLAWYDRSNVIVSIGKVGMSKKRKLYNKLLSGSKNFRFEDFITLLIAFGFTQDRTRGSHRLFKHPGIPEFLTIQPSLGGQAKPYQIRQFLSLIEIYDLRLQDDDSDEENDEES
jgi:predicted RNA binding protein YcfA (HicA-like mRNA interferase family)